MIPSREITLPASSRDKKVSAAFKASVGIHGAKPWDCKRGMHEPEWDETFADWGCKHCGKALTS